MTTHLIWLAQRGVAVEVLVRRGAAVDSLQKARLAEAIPELRDRFEDCDFGEFLWFVESNYRKQGIRILSGKGPCGTESSAETAGPEGRNWLLRSRRDMHRKRYRIWPEPRPWLKSRWISRRRRRVHLEAVLMDEASEDKALFFEKKVERVATVWWPPNAPRLQLGRQGPIVNSTWSSLAFLSSQATGSRYGGSYLVLAWSHGEPHAPAESLCGLRIPAGLLLEGLLMHPTHATLGEGYPDGGPPDLPILASSVAHAKKACRQAWGEDVCIHVLEPQVRLYPGRPSDRSDWPYEAERTYLLETLDQEQDWIEALVGQSNRLSLPVWASAALLRDRESEDSRLALCWFHDEPHAALDSILYDAISTVDWGAHASDLDAM